MTRHWNRSRFNGEVRYREPGHGYWVFGLVILGLLAAGCLLLLLVACGRTVL